MTIKFVNSATILENIVQQFLKKLSLHLSYDLAIFILDIYSREMKVKVHTETCPWLFTVALFVIAPNCGNNPNVHEQRNG